MAPTTSCPTAGRRRSRHRPSRPLRFDRATVEDFLAGRSDRMGVDLLLDARTSGERSATSAPAVPEVADLVVLLRARRPDVVWLLHAFERSTPWLQAMARLVDAAGAVLVALDDDPDAEALLSPRAPGGSPTSAPPPPHRSGTPPTATTRPAI